MVLLLSYWIRIHRCRLFRNDILAFSNQGKIEEVTVKSFDTIEEKRMHFVLLQDRRNDQNAIRKFVGWRRTGPLRSFTTDKNIFDRFFSTRFKLGQIQIRRAFIPSKHSFWTVLFDLEYNFFFQNLWIFQTVF